MCRQCKRRLIRDGAGNLYGTTSEGGENDDGTVFEVSPRQGGWKESVLHSFGNVNDGSVVFGSVVMDRAGDLYGTTLTVELVDWLREQRAYSGVDPLMAQIKKDIVLTVATAAKDLAKPIAV